MRICIASDSYYPHPGGVTEHIHHTAIELRRLGHDVKILTGDFGDNQGFDGPDVLRVGRSVLVPANKSFASITVGFSLIRDVKKILRTGDFDIVHTHGPLGPSIPILSLICSESVNIGTFHAATPHIRSYQFLSPAMMPIFKKIHGPIAVSEAARDTIGKYFPGKYRIIPNGVDIERFSPEQKPIPEYDDGRPNILFVGRFDPRKGLKYLLMAMPKIAEAIPEVRLLVVGKGFLKNYYQRFLDPKVANLVEFLGYVEPEHLPRYYTTAHVFCSPATGAESFGIILLEAMASGTPLIASNIDGYNGVVDHMEDGFLVPPMDPDSLAQGIIELLRDGALRSRFRDKGLEKAGRFSWKSVTRTLEQYYLEVMERVSTR
jgi:phosphatidylinositol alpha-mannosyltransferase